MYGFTNPLRRYASDASVALLAGGMAIALPALLAAQEEEPEREHRCICVGEGAVAWADAVPNLRIFGQRAMLGVMLGSQSGEEGVPIEDVTDDGPADRAGLRPGDVLTAIDDLDLTDMDAEEAADALVDYLADEVEPGDTVEVVYERDGDIRQASIVTEEGGLRSFAWTVRPGGRVTVRPPVIAEAPHFDFDVVTPRVPRSAVEPDVQVGVLRRFMGSVFGLHLMDLNPQLGSYFNTDRGVLVTEVDEDSELGLRAGDVILRIDGREVDDAAHAWRILRSYEEDEAVEIEIMRDRRRTTVTGVVR